MKATKLMVVNWVLLLAIMSSCASSYHAVNPRHLYYPTEEPINGLSFSYRYNMLKENGNKKYAKKEFKKDIDVVAIELTNHTSQPLSFREDIELFAGDNYVRPMETEIAYKELNQNTPIYLLYLLLTPLRVFFTNSNGETSSFPAGLILGPGITTLNMVKAGSANRAFREELRYNHLINRTVEPGETVRGIVALSSTNHAPLRAKVARHNLTDTEN